MDNICRLCSSRSRSSTSIFDSKNGKLIADQVKIICPIKIGISDDLPKTICNLCLRIISEAVELREKSIATDQNLRKKLSEKETKGIKKSVKFQENAAPESVKLEKESNLINFIDESLVGHQNFDDFDDNDGDDNSGFMDYDEPENHDNSDIVNYEPPAKIQKRDTGFLKRTIENDIDAITDISELKILMKTFHKRLCTVENVLQGPEEVVEEPVKKGDFLMNKISTMTQFNKFVEDISFSKELRDYLVAYWKVIPHSSRQSPENGKVYAILLSLFDEDFLYNHVKWGHGTKKECTKREASSNTIALKTVTHLMDMIKEALGIQSDANSQLTSIFKNLFRNKIKRDMIRGANPGEISQYAQKSIAQGLKDQMSKND